MKHSGKDDKMFAGIQKMYNKMAKKGDCGDNEHHKTEK